MIKRILETQRLFLEELNDVHFQDLYRLLSNEKVHKYFQKTLNERESKEFLEKIKTKYREDGFCFWAVKRKEDNAFIGICGLLRQNIDEINEIEVAYRINDAYWNNGYGTEAAKGCMIFAKDYLKIDSIISLILPENRQSVRVAEKNGMRFEKKSLFHYRMHDVYRKSFKQKKKIMG